MPRKLTFVAAALLTLTALAAPDGVRAQAKQAGPHAPRRVPVTVALSDTLPAGAVGFAILRRADRDPRDVILLRRDADSTALSAAVDQLILVRRVQGDTVTSSGMVRVRPREGARRGPRTLPWAHRVVADLHRTAPRTVAGVGTLPAVVIWIPPQRGRGVSRP